MRWQGRPRRAVIVAVLALGGALLLALLAGALVTPDRGGREEAFAPTATASPTPTATPEPTPAPHAPDGRTGDAELDAIIEALLTEDSAGMVSRFGAIDIYESDGPPESWMSRLAGSERSLYAVRTPARQAPALAPLDFEIIIATPGHFEPDGWLFGVIDGEVVRVYPPLADPFGIEARSYLSDFQSNYDTYLVLPPIADLPQPPEGHPLSVRTGDSGVDELLALVEANDISGLIDAVEYRQEPCAGPLLELDACQNGDAGSVDVLPATRNEPGDTTGPELCWGDMSLQDSAYVRRWFEAWGEPVAIHAVATIARDYERTEGLAIGGDHEMMVVLQLDRYTWQVGSLYERDGRIVGIRCRPDPSYPDPREIPYIVQPPTDGSLPPLSRRSGVAVVDALLDALQASDVEVLGEVIDPETVQCVDPPRVLGSPPACRDGESPGTPVEVFTAVACEGGYARMDDFFGPDAEYSLRILNDSDWRLYALVEVGQVGSFRRSEMEAILVTSGEERDRDGGTWPRGANIGLSSQGVTIIRSSCQGLPPEERIERVLSPSFLLPPP